MEDPGVRIGVISEITPERASELERQCARNEAEDRRDALKVAAGCIAWTMFGMTMMGWSFSMDEFETASVVFVAGSTLGSIGVLVTLVMAWRRSLTR